MPFEKISLSHLMGTDAIGRDVFVRICCASITSIHIAVVSTFCSFMIGLPYGCLAGYIGGYIGSTMSAALDIMESIPEFLVAMILMTFFCGTGLSGNYGIMITLIIVSWTSMARIMKNETVLLMERNYIKYASMKNATFLHIFQYHLFPNLLSTVFSVTIQKIPSAIFLEAFLSFIGIGIQPPRPSLGKMISESTKYFRKAPTLLIFPSVFLLIIIAGFNILSFSMRPTDDSSCT